MIDFFGFSSKATGFPVDFVYPTVTTLVPANIAIVKDAPHPKAAAAFIEYLLSIEGQELLLDPAIRRLPVNPETYAKAPKDFPNPFKDSSIGAAVKFDVVKSKTRYNIVNSLFDVMITYRREDLAQASEPIQKAETALAGKSNSEAEALISEAHALVAAMPISEEEAIDGKFPGVFTSGVYKKRRKHPGQTAVMLLIFGFLSVFLMIPVVQVVFVAFMDAATGGFILLNFKDFFATALFRESFWNSIYVGIMAVVLASAFSMPLADFYLAV